MLVAPRSNRRTALCRTLVLGLLGVVGCAGAGRAGSRASSSPSGGGGQLLTADAIGRMNVVSAWDVVRRSGFMLTPTTDRSGRPSRLRTRRGRSSLVLANSDTPLVVLDGVRTLDFRVLEQVPARTLLYVRYVGGIEATVSQGTDAGGGMIELRTRSDAPD